MPLEATVICVDNSEFMRNGDVAPSRMQARSAPGVETQRARALAAVSSVFCDADEHVVSGRCSHPGVSDAVAVNALTRAELTPARAASQAQADAVNLLAGAKTQANPESCVGVLSLAGKVPKMLVTPTPDLGKVLNSLQDVPLDGVTHVSTGVQVRVVRRVQTTWAVQMHGLISKTTTQVAVLALKYRQNRNQRQRIVLFVGSPVDADEETLVKLGKKLKKNNVALDVVLFANLDVNEQKLAAFVAATNSGGNSNMVVVPPGPLALADVLISSPVFAGDGDGAVGSGFAAAAAAGAAAAARQMGAGGGGDFDFEGVDPSLDPELALALRVSMEEERARQEAAAKAAAEAAARGEGQDAAMQDATPAATPAAPVAAAVTGGGDVDMAAMDEDALLQQALAMSMAAGAPGGPAVSVPPAASAQGAPALPAEFADDPELALALQMSMAEAAEEAAKKETGGGQ
jgi:26S proteasome regulatory subunit N10